jgi:hypothetical protein
VASFGYEHQRARVEPAATEPAGEERGEEGAIWPLLSLTPDLPLGLPDGDRTDYFRAPAAYPVGEETAVVEEPEKRDEETATAAPAAAAKSLRHGTPTDQVDATYAYESHEPYTVLDDAGSPIPAGFDVNEKFGAASYDYAGSDWRQGDEGGSHSNGTSFYDQMQGESAGHTPTPKNPQTPRGSTKVQHWAQSWFIGSTDPGKGTKVQTNTFQKYQDHARHENIKSPP